MKKLARACGVDILALYENKFSADFGGGDGNHRADFHRVHRAGPGGTGNNHGATGSGQFECAAIILWGGAGSATRAGENQRPHDYRLYQKFREQLRLDCGSDHLSAAAGRFGGRLERDAEPTQSRSGCRNGNARSAAGGFDELHCGRFDGDRRADGDVCANRTANGLLR